MSQNHYYLSAEGQTIGPYSAPQVRKRLNQQKSTVTDYIWREGFESWKRIADVLDELPHEEPPPTPAPNVPDSLTINHPDFPDIPTTKIAIPQRGVFEPKATLSQKNKLMKLGCTTPELLRNLGRDQASFMIDAMLQDAQAVFQHEYDKRSAEKRRAIGVLFLALLALAVIVVLATWIRGGSSSQESAAVKRQVRDISPAASPTSRVALSYTPSATSTVVPSVSGSQRNVVTQLELPTGTVVTLIRDVTVHAGSGTVTLSSGRRMTFLRRQGDSARIRYAGADYIVPISAISPPR